MKAYTEFQQLIEPVLVPITNSLSISIRLVNHNGHRKIDIRNCVKFNQDQKFHLLKKGVMIELEAFREKILPILNNVSTL